MGLMASPTEPKIATLRTLLGGGATAGLAGVGMILKGSVDVVRGWQVSGGGVGCAGSVSSTLLAALILYF